MSLVATRAPRLGNLVKAEYMQEHGFCRKTVNLIAAGDAQITLGTVLGKMDDGTGYKVLDPAATDGTQIAAAVTLSNIDVVAGDNKAPVFVNGPLILGRNALLYTPAVTDEQKATAEAQLEALFMKVHEQV